MAFEIKYSKEAEENLDAITAWLLYERLTSETALRWLQGLRKKINTLSEQPERCILARESKSLYIRRPGEKAVPFKLGLSSAM